MLVLTRKLDQSIMIGDDIEIRVVEVTGEKIKLGIIAPKNIPVHRKEIYEAIQAENISASKSPRKDMKDLAKVFKKK